MTLVVAWVSTSGSVRFTVTGALAGQTVKRVAPGDTLQVIRGYGDPDSWVSGGAGFGYDYEMPLGVTVRYALVDQAAVTLPGGTPTASIFTETPGRQNGEAWLRDIMQPILSQPISVLSTGDERRVARQAVYDIAGKPNPVVVWDSRTSRQGTVTLAVQNLPVSGVWATDTPRDKMDLLLSSGRPLLLSMCANLGFHPCYMAVADATYTRVGDGALWALQLDYVEVDNPSALGVYPVAEVTYTSAQQIPPDAIYQDWTTVTYLDIATENRMITLPGDLLAIQSQGHRVRPRLYTRMPVGGGWVEMQVVEATVTFNEPGQFPSRTLDATVLLDTADGRILTESFDEQLVDWAHVPLCPLGSWVKAEQVITRPTGEAYTVPWGVYRVDTLDVDELTGSCRFTCSDASQQIADRKLVTLAMGRVKATDRFQTVMDRMCAEVFAGNIVPWWTGPHLVNLALVVDRAFGGKGAQYDEGRMDALAALGAILANGWRLVTPRATNLGVLRLIHPGGGELGTALVAAGTNLIYAEISDAADRGDLFNEVVATYTWSGAGGFGRTVTQQRRMVAQYNDAGEELRVGGPFGYVTRDSISVEVPDKMTSAAADNEAEKQAYAAIGRSMYWSRDITVQTSPIYGLEQGDRVLIRTEVDDPGQAGTLVGATVPLHAAGGAWRLTVRLTKIIDPSWTPRYYKAAESTEYSDSGLQWVDFNPNARAVDTTDGRGDGTGRHNNVNRKWRGWHWSGAKASKGGSSLLLTSGGGNITLYTDRGWTGTVYQRRYKAAASLTAPHGTIKARIGVDTLTQGVIWGAWTTYKHTKSATIAVDTATKIATGSVNFGVRIETQGMQNNEQIRVNSIAVQAATWTAS